MTGFVSSDLRDGLASITFGHPNHNALNSDLLIRLEAEILNQGSHPDVKIILLKSQGDRTFCAGASLHELANVKDRLAASHFFMGFARVINAIRSCGKIVIGRVHGKAVGGGVGLCAACDYTMATKWGSARLSELTLGIGPFVIAPAIRRKIGVAGLAKLTLNPQEWLTAQQCYELGLYQDVFDTTEQLDNYLDRYVQSMLQYSPLALDELKKMLWVGTDHWSALLTERAKISGDLVMTPNAQSAIRQILS